MKPKVYIETSIPSFYYEVRPEPEMVARRQWTRHWGDNFRRDYLLVTSVAVLDVPSLVTPLELHGEREENER